jgi:hypothetical protein
MRLIFKGKPNRTENETVKPVENDGVIDELKSKLADCESNLNQFKSTTHIKFRKYFDYGLLGLLLLDLLLAIIK